MSTALRTCPECGTTDRVASSNTHPFTRTCRPCASRHNVAAMLAANRARPPAPRPLDPYVVDLLVSGVPERATVAERIAAIRRLPAMSAAQLAGRLGVSARSVVRYRARMREAA